MRYHQTALLVFSWLALTAPPVWAVPPSAGASCTDYAENANACHNNGCFICVSGAWQVQPLLIGNTTATCTTSLAGQMRWTGTAMEFCNGTAWISLGSGGPGPTPFSFVDQTGVALSSTITSNAVTLANFTGSLTATCAGCTAIARNGIWGGTTVSGFVAGDQIALRQTSSASVNTTTTASVMVGATTSSPWSVKTGSVALFNYTGSDQTFTVPAGVTSVTVKLWGAGGASGNDNNNTGGAGGYTTGVLSVTPGSTLTVIVGQGGVAGDHITAYGGGGGGYFGGGGGRSAVRISGTEVATAGGGGGGTNANTPQNGGSGGGTTGGSSATNGGNRSGCSVTIGYGGTQSAGGAGSNPGTQYTGGTTTANGCAGAGGGGGYYGGGAGANGGSSGGGSGYIGSMTSASTTNGSGTVPPNTSDPYYAAGVGIGGPAGGTYGTAGGNGRVAIIY